MLMLSAKNDFKGKRICNILLIMCVGSFFDGQMWRFVGHKD